MILSCVVLHYSLPLKLIEDKRDTVYDYIFSIDIMKDENLRDVLCEETKEIQGSCMNCKDDTLKREQCEFNQVAGIDNTSTYLLKSEYVDQRHAC